MKCGFTGKSKHNHLIILKGITWQLLIMKVLFYRNVPVTKRFINQTE
ncbi:hypothetical protein AHMF7616_00292 [Adhaeribacter pallidiroseus]|uniref:Uncharacterized protein n=1 Tax=Adhaeribacter pallidiroseus TaxID=2072847 RepID=A0A369Q9Y8_9BACT|nr:hypothetical protein AHMF7616_00292 [Adhaeribacter pallidiroseus]